MTGLGIRKIKLTGGEPLIRKNCATLVRMLKELPGIEKVTLNNFLMADGTPVYTHGDYMNGDGYYMGDKTCLLYTSSIPERWKTIILFCII